jgi:2,4-dienoyl-CoA reductase-like NADH-dependent reductase (Old Yellow Enzyme family)
MTRDILDRAAEAVEGTTPGDWCNTTDSGEITDAKGHYVARAINAATREGKSNARFIAASRQLVPEMAAEIAALRSALDLIASGQVDAVALARAALRQVSQK